MNGKKILVVDDNPVITKTLSMKLTSAGYQVVTAADGSEAVGAAQKERPNLILLDISFPPDTSPTGVEWDGFKIISWLRRIEAAKDTPVIVISGGEPEKYKDRSLATGAIAYFPKPIDNDELLDVIQKTLSAVPAKPASV
jgi:CheY-like chemotaxis protein